MKRLTAYVGAGAMFIAFLTAPLFHFHDRDDHGSPVSLIHAHFLGSVGSDHHPDGAVESAHLQNHKARWIDVFTFNAPPSGFDLAVDLVETLSAPILDVQQGVTSLPAPQSHGPPGVRLSIPRSPPIL